jgi:uncharacterized protein
MKYAQQGVRLFIFGSWARRDQRRTSDLDIGVLWRGSPDRRLFSSLARDVEELPTIRPIDLVDFAEVSERFRKEAMRHIIPLEDVA